MRKKKTPARRKKGILVQVVRTGGRVEECYLDEDEPTVGDALNKVGIRLTKGDRVRIDGDVADEDTIVEEGNIITIAGKVSGGQ